MTTKATSKNKKPETPKQLVPVSKRVSADKPIPFTKPTSTILSTKHLSVDKLAAKKPVVKAEQEKAKPKAKTVVPVASDKVKKLTKANEAMDRTPTSNLKRIMTEGTKAMAATVVTEQK